MNISHTDHPYYPPSAVIHGFVPKALSTSTILAIFATTSTAVLYPTFLAIRRIRPTLPTTEVAAALCDTSILTQMWKEYALSDSRYLTMDAFMFCMEAITSVFWGPMSLLCAYSIVYDLPWRHSLQTVISLGQLYGDVLYYGTCAFDEIVYHKSYSRPERYYFWGYFMLLNAFWIVIPLVLLVNSFKQTSKAFAKAKAMEQNAK
ncbi:hypothetical protein K4F52_004926 [Lecanicillium sp. MT-2017a]|nr:hypothetical protein K4F52_004926 [Lecanicillium sp. MT-2017a]